MNSQATRKPGPRPERPRGVGVHAARRREQLRELPDRGRGADARDQREADRQRQRLLRVRHRDEDRVRDGGGGRHVRDRLEQHLPEPDRVLAQVVETTWRGGSRSFHRYLLRRVPWRPRSSRTWAAWRNPWRGYNCRPPGVCPSGQRERAVNPSAQPTEVRILPPPSLRAGQRPATTRAPRGALVVRWFARLTAIRCRLLRGVARERRARDVRERRGRRPPRASRRAPRRSARSARPR